MYLGIDLGTSSVKAVVVDGAQRILAAAAAPLSVSRPRALWSEQSPGDWWAAVELAVLELRGTAGVAWSAISAIGLSGQMHGLVLLDEAGLPLRPAILHNDGRAFAEAEALNRQLPDIGAIAGVPAMPGFAAPKLLWLARHEPEVLARARHVLLPKDYVRFRLTGAFATDMCDASGALLLDTGKRQWSPEIVRACGIGMDVLPAALEGNAVSGTLSKQRAAHWGLVPGISVAAGAGDAAAGAVASGAVNAGDAFISLGTATQYFVARTEYRPAPQHLIHSFCHGLPNRWFQMAALLNGAGALAWAAGLLGKSDIGALLAETERAFTGPSPVLFLPYLSGERTPHNNPHAKGVLFGLTPSTTPEQVTQAVLEGVALSLADVQGSLEETGALPDRIAVNGGGSRSRFWMRILASALNKTVLLQDGSESGPAFGAARLARLAATGEDPAAVCSKPRITEEIAPDQALADAYGQRLTHFRALYRAVVPLF
ncbi:xylulokinase [Aestuariivirga sp.]|uniref:xylulokinase n=1 Tax=Aestuariivirga sp. TaxID=2650926 RepID=UPI003BA8513A